MLLCPASRSALRAMARSGSPTTASSPALLLLSAAATERFFSSSRPATADRKPPSLLTLADLTVPQIQTLITRAGEMKQKVKSASLALPASSRVQPKHGGDRLLEQTLTSKSVAMIFTKRSTRTRVASETSIALLGGTPMFLGKEDIQLGVNESLYDSARVIGSMVDGIMARVNKHAEVETLACEAGVPVVNALSDRYHPTQILADLLTLVETFGRSSQQRAGDSTGPLYDAPSSVAAPSSPFSLSSLANLRVAWVGDSNNILNDMLVAYPRLGIDLSVATPKGYSRDEIVWQRMEEGLRMEGGSGAGQVEWSNDPREAVKDADVVVTDTWVSMGDEAQKAQRLRDFAGFQVTEELCREGGAKPDWKFMHCLPRKAEEVDDATFYNEKRSLVFPEAENRKWTIAAIFDALIGRWEIPSA